jgi:ABC-type glutathione transport system ATPase component
MVFQEPFASLNPVMRISEQVDEVLAAHSVMNRRERSVKVLSTFRELGLAEDVLFKYPHELSGGMCQRVLIACSLICDPEVMIMDEPTTALDVTVQQQILGLIERIRSERSPAILFISHDLSVVSRVADDIYVMKKGSVVESGPAEQVLKRPSAPYTRKLMECIPRLGDKRRRLPE